MRCSPHGMAVNHDRSGYRFFNEAGSYIERRYSDYDSVYAYRFSNGSWFMRKPVDINEPFGWKVRNPHEIPEFIVGINTLLEM